jgi:hypothetical protein
VTSSTHCTVAPLAFLVLTVSGSHSGSYVLTRLQWLRCLNSKGCHNHVKLWDALPRVGSVGGPQPHHLPQGWPRTFHPRHDEVKKDGFQCVGKSVDSALPLRLERSALVKPVPNCREERTRESGKLQQ